MWLISGKDSGRDSPNLGMMKTQFCPICGPRVVKKQLYRQNFILSQITARVFSARRRPDRIHYRLVRCGRCGLVFSDPVLPLSQLTSLYRESRFTYSGHVADLTKTYGYYLRYLEKYGVIKDRLLEIGCGNGFMLLEAKRQGYREVWGVEPSGDAVRQAPETIRPYIKQTVFRPKLFSKNYFDAVCFFQTFDHISQPNNFLKACFDLLKPGGLILAFNHNVESLQAKLLKEKSPIIDVEHTYLYSPATMRLIFKKNKFQVLRIGPSFNIYPIDYLWQLLSAPKWLKPPFNFKLKLPIGNLFLAARKPK